MQCALAPPNPKPALLVSGARTGGTFLCVALSNHPRIFCTRGEPLHSRSEWYRAIPNLERRLGLLLRQQFYEVSMCKVNVGQFIPLRVAFLQDFTPRIRVLHLEREDVLAQSISILINRMKLESHPTHTFLEPAPIPLTLDPARVADAYRAVCNRNENLTERLQMLGLPILRLTYEEITGGREATMVPEPYGRRICAFLEVPYVSLHAHTRKIHKNFAKSILNWDEILEVAKGITDAS